LQPLETAQVPGLELPASVFRAAIKAAIGRRRSMRRLYKSFFSSGNLRDRLLLIPFPAVESLSVDPT